MNTPIVGDRLYTKVKIVGVALDVYHQHTLMLHIHDVHYKANLNYLKNLNGKCVESVEVVPALHPKLGEWKALVAEGHTTQGFDDWLVQCGGKHG